MTMISVRAAPPLGYADAEPSLHPPFGAYQPSRAQAAVIGLAQATFLKRGFFRQGVSRLIERLRPGPIDATFRGASFRVYLGDTTTEWAILLYADYNKAEFDFLAAGLGPGGVFVDVGANVGLYSLSLARLVGPAGRVVAIEPDRDSLGRLRANGTASGAANVVIVPVAAGDREGEVRFQHDDNLGLSQVSESATLRVPMRPLAAIVAEAGVDHVDALKIDIEGFEDRVLLPFFRNAPRALWPARIVIEVGKAGRWRDDCMAALARVGYRSAAQTRNNALLVLDGTEPPRRG